MNNTLRKIIATALPVIFTGGAGYWLWTGAAKPAANPPDAPATPPLVQPQPPICEPVAPPDGSGVIAIPPALSSTEPENPPAAAAGMLPLSLAIEDARELSSAPFATQFFAAGGFFRRLMMAADSLAHGERPLAALDFLLPPAQFEAVKNADGHYVASPQSIARFQGAVDAYCSIDPAAAAKWYRSVKPLFLEAYHALGYTDDDFEALLRQAAETVLTTPECTSDPILFPTGQPGGFRYLDPALERLNDAQKLLLRLGADNFSRVKNQTAMILNELN